MKPYFPLVLLLPALAPLSSAQNPLQPGESPSNHHQYLSFHNAYQWGEAYVTEVLDRWNVWDLELDVRWRDTRATDGYLGFYVLHHCFDFAGEGTLDSYLIAIAASRRAREGFFFLNIEFNDGYICLGDDFEGPVFPSNYKELFEAKLLNYFTRAEIYTWSDFDADGRMWPSVQELIRRKKRVAVHINRDATGTMFFRRAGFGSFASQLAFYNTDDETLDGGSGLGDRYFSRRYPAFSCDFESSANWETAFDNGFSFPSTNCLELRIDDHRYDLHPPVPSYVSTVSGADEGWTGTADRPWVGGLGLLNAIGDVRFYENNTGEDAPGIIRIEPGTYDVSPYLGQPLGPLTLPDALQGPVRLEKRGSGPPVRLQ